MDATADEAVAGQWHGRFVDFLRNAEQADLASCSSCEEHISVDKSEVVGSSQPRVW